MEKLERENDSTVEPVNSYSVLHPGSDQVQIVLRNLSVTPSKLFSYLFFGWL